MDITPQTHASLCAGYEGIGIGLRRVFPTCRTALAVKAEAFCVANLTDKMHSGYPHLFTSGVTFAAIGFCILRNAVAVSTSNKTVSLRP